MRYLPSFLLAAIFLLSACDSGDPGVGPCVHIYEEPVLNITSVTDEDTSAEIAQVQIYDVFVDEVARGTEDLTAMVSENITVEGATLLCTLPCGFGTEEGLYTFSVNAEGYQETMVSQRAEYATFEGGCPSYNTDGTRFSFSMSAD